VVDGNGRTLTVRFSDATFEGRKYLECTRIDFRERKDMDEDKILKQSPCLDEVLNVLPYEKLNAMFFQLEGDGAATEEDKDSPPSRTTSGSKAGKSGTSAKTPDVGADDDDDDDEPVQKLADIKAGKKPKFAEGDWVTFKDEDGDTVVGKITDIDDDDVEVADANGETHDTTLDTLSPASEPKKAAKPEKTKPAPASKAPKDEDEDEDGEIKVGSRVRADNGKVGTVTKIDDEDVTVKGVGGKTWTADMDDLTLEPEAENDTPPDDEDDDDDADEGEAAPAFAVGDKVTWDDGDESGEILKLKGDKARVKDSDGDEISVPLAELTKAKPAKAKK
jgi:preprotein translocase subunit YajC